MTCSIVAIDRDAGQAGLAIASCCWDAGQVCVAVPGIGAMASQAQGNVRLLRLFADQRAAGRSLGEVMDCFRAEDSDIEARQIGMVASDGEVLAFTGQKCSYWAGHRVGAGYSCQGNILVGPEVIAGMARAFEGTEGPLFERLYAALAAADAAGGDARGRQSARLMVAGPGASAPRTVIDLRIEDHDNPIEEIGRMLGVGRHLRKILACATALSSAAAEDKPGILAGLRELLEGKLEPRYLDWWETLAQGYDDIGRTEDALEAYRIYLAINPGLAGIIHQNARAGRFPMRLAEALGVS